MPQVETANRLADQFLPFVQQQARQMRADDRPPTSLDQWKQDRQQLRQRLTQSWGPFPEEPCPLQPRIVGQIQRDGYRVERLLLQTLPDVWMTANAYVPDGTGRRPAVLCVHGHWRLAKQEPVVQSRCIGLAKLGFFVLMVDAMGAGERGVGKALGEYHGEMAAATLWPSGRALAGLQVYENARAVDYLQTRAEVDPQKIGVTGASGGGNQTMYAGAMDDRLQCVVPVCSVGNYQAYLGAACCMCELVPSVLSYTEEAAVLSLVAPRALMVVNATRDAFQFSVNEARKSLLAARPVYQLYGCDERLRHAVFESPHDYNQAMREAMYGWMTLHLKGEGDGTPIAEPTIEVEEAETLRCYPGDSRPGNFQTLPQWAAAESRRLLAMRPVPTHAEHWQAEQMMMRGALPGVLGPQPARQPLELKADQDDAAQALQFVSEAGIQVVARRERGQGMRRGLAVVLDLEQGRNASKSELAANLLRNGWDVVTADLRATGGSAYPRDSIGRAPDHNTAEWSMMIGRPLLGQWVWDVRRLLDALQADPAGLPESTLVIGVGTASVVALCAAALDSRLDAVATIGGLASYVSDVPYEKQRMGIMAPGLLRDVGDVPQIAALIAPRPLLIAGGVRGNSEPLGDQQLQDQFAWTRSAYKLSGAADSLRILVQTEPQRIVELLE